VPDVFISYAREDRTTAQAFAQALQQRGLAVWWDHDIPPGKQFDEEIEAALDGSRCVVVLWSKYSATSKWVKTEAGEAAAQDKLLPVLITPGVRLPLEFRRVQTADLSSWQAGQTTPALEQVCTAVANVVANSPVRTVTRARPPKPAPVPAPVPTPQPAPAPGPAPAPATGRQPWMYWTAAGVVVVAVLAAVLYESDDGLQPQPPPGSGMDLRLQWRDYALNYEGRLVWDGNATLGHVEVRATDGASGRVVAQGAHMAAIVPNTPGRLIFYVQVPVPLGDSSTPGPHTHAVNLVFERGSASQWRFVGNCMALNRADSCYPA
jgi:TIR domain